MRVLLVEDNARLAEPIAAALRRSGYAVDTAGTAADCRQALAGAAYDLLLLDLGLPDEDGTTLLRGLRASGVRTPVLVVTARGSLDERIEGLDRGADDYLVKPFHVDELLARCRAVLRRPGGRLAAVLAAGDLTLDTNSREVRVAGRMVALPPKEIAVLTVLLRRAGHVVGKEVIEQALTEFGREVTPNAVEANVSRLRRRLAVAGTTVVVETVRGVGYLIRETPDGPSRPA